MVLKTHGRLDFWSKFDMAKCKAGADQLEMSARNAYTRPRLAVFGHMTQLTAAGSVNAAENQNQLPGGTAENFTKQRP